MDEPQECYFFFRKVFTPFWIVRDLSGSQLSVGLLYLMNASVDLFCPCQSFFFLFLSFAFFSQCRTKSIELYSCSVINTQCKTEIFFWNLIPDFLKSLRSKMSPIYHVKYGLRVTCWVFCESFFRCKSRRNVLLVNFLLTNSQYKYFHFGCVD